MTELPTDYGGPAIVRATLGATGWVTRASADEDTSPLRLARIWARAASRVPAGCEVMGFVISAGQWHRREQPWEQPTHDGAMGVLRELFPSSWDRSCAWQGDTTG
jgi:hypothetical protein